MAELTAVIVDDHPAVRAGVAHWLTAGDPPIRVAASGDNARAAWTGEGATADVVILDLHLGGPAPAMDELRRLTEAGRRVVVYTMRVDGDLALQCLELGALSYLTKDEGAEHLLEAAAAAAEGRAYTPPSLAGALAGDRSATRPALSARETEVLIEWFQSESKAFVGRRLGISPHTVNTHLEHIRLKYAMSGRQAPTKAALLARAIQDGLVGLDDL
ncbi:MULTISPECIES: response regulator [Streptomyces]|uniref:Response regulatory domain-containing protein n=4 Tax=Streptomyces TaxID=1883 RepID=A0A8H9HPG0_9ACTN|nr:MULTISPECIES: response regulator transcription factor [Streptomyces]NEE33396.1 response regulator transcription factor [Streptomyces sp. SID7982]NEE54259.1 response regulator transcription factor [Streptomyces sp. SID8455]MBL3806742.1 response regulator transcription factor [Streptomyces sp. BRB081]MDQ0295528.1 DNA-binding NarL/FixJ family response regulator [Streptomyces sp. DSM 41037]NEC12747.1 response regulator transcription factor [Streptomyces sp. SID8014]